MTDTPHDHDQAKVDRVILFRVTQEEHQRVRDIAKAEDRTMASAIRRMFRIGLDAYQPHIVEAATTPAPAPATSTPD